MLCEFPDLSKLDIHENEFYIGFIMDGIREYEVMNQITVVKDPSFYYFTEPENVKTVHVYQTSLTIMVRNMFVLQCACCSQSNKLKRLFLPYK